MLRSGRSLSTMIGSATRFRNARYVARSVMVYARRSSAIPRVWPIPCPHSRYHVPREAIPACFQSSSSRRWVPDLSPRETNRDCVSAIRSRASTALARPLTLAGSSAGPTRTKSLYMTSRRFRILPSATYFFSSAGAWHRLTSASPRAASASACPVPTAIVLTEYPVCFSNIGTRTSSRPESWVLVVVERITTLEGVWAVAGAGPALHASAATSAAASPSALARVHRGIRIVSSAGLDRAAWRRRRGASSRGRRAARRPGDRKAWLTTRGDACPTGWPSPTVAPATGRPGSRHLGEHAARLARVVAAEPRQRLVERRGPDRLDDRLRGRPEEGVLRDHHVEPLRDQRDEAEAQRLRDRAGGHAGIRLAAEDPEGDRPVGRHRVRVAGDARGLHAGPGEGQIHEPPGAGAGLAVHEADPGPGEVGHARQPARVAGGHHQAEVAVEEVHERRRPGLQLGPERRAVVLPRLPVHEVHRRDVGEPRRHRLEPCLAPDAGGEEHGRAGLDREDLPQQVERRVVAPGQEDPQGAAASRLAGRRGARRASPGARLKPFLEEVLGEEPLPGDPRRGDRAALGQEVDGPGVEAQVAGGFGHRQEPGWHPPVTLRRVTERCQADASFSCLLMGTQSTSSESWRPAIPQGPRRGDDVGRPPGVHLGGEARPGGRPRLATRRPRGTAVIPAPGRAVPPSPAATRLRWPSDAPPPRPTSASGRVGGSSGQE